MNASLIVTLVPSLEKNPRVTANSDLYPAREQTITLTFPGPDPHSLNCPFRMTDYSDLQRIEMLKVWVPRARPMSRPGEDLKLSTRNLKFGHAIGVTKLKVLDLKFGT